MAEDYPRMLLDPEKRFSPNQACRRRFIRRKSALRGKLFYRLAQQAVQVEPVPFEALAQPQPLAARGKSLKQPESSAFSIAPSQLLRQADDFHHGLLGGWLSHVNIPFSACVTLRQFAGPGEVTRSRLPWYGSAAFQGLKSLAAIERPVLKTPLFIHPGAAGRMKTPGEECGVGLSRVAGCGQGRCGAYSRVLVSPSLRMCRRSLNNSPKARRTTLKLAPVCCPAVRG